MTWLCRTAIWISGGYWSKSSWNKTKKWNTKWKHYWSVLQLHNVGACWLFRHLLNESDFRVFQVAKLIGDDHVCIHIYSNSIVCYTQGVLMKWWERINTVITENKEIWLEGLTQDQFIVSDEKNDSNSIKINEIVSYFVKEKEKTLHNIFLLLIDAEKSGWTDKRRERAWPQTVFAIWTHNIKVDEMFLILLFYVIFITIQSQTQYQHVVYSKWNDTKSHTSGNVRDKMQGIFPLYPHSIVKLLVYME